MSLRHVASLLQLSGLSLPESPNPLLTAGHPCGLQSGYQLEDRMTGLGRQGYWQCWGRAGGGLGGGVETSNEAGISAQPADGRSFIPDITAAALKP